MSDPFEPNTRARSSDPDTSHLAAESVAYKMTALRIEVLQLFVREIQMTDLTLQALCRDHRSTYRTRRSELAQMGYVADTGIRILQAGSKRIIWRITTRGIEAAKVFQ